MEKRTIPEFMDFEILERESFAKTTLQFIQRELRLFYYSVRSAFKPPVALLKWIFSSSVVDKHVLHQARSYEIIPDKSNGIAILMSHGFAGTPEIFREIGPILAREGYYVRAIRLKGHGTTAADMSRTSGVDWFSTIVWHYKDISKKYDRMFYLGHSLGGTLGLLLSTLYPIETIVALSTPINLHISSAKYVRQMSMLVRYWPRSKRKKLAIREAGIATYQKTPLYAIGSIFEVTRLVRERADKLKLPVLYVRSGLDHKTLVDQPNEYRKFFPNTPTTFKDAENSPHSQLLGPEKDMVNEWIVEWFEKYK